MRFLRGRSYRCSGTLLPLVLLAVAGCGVPEVSTPESLSARILGNVELGDEPFEIVAVSVHLPPRTTFRAREFRLAYRIGGEGERAGEINCCVGLTLGELAVSPTAMQRVEEFGTEDRTTLAELGFLVPPSTTEATLLYDGAPAGPTMTIER